LFAGAGPGADKIKELFHVLENNLAKIRIKKEERSFISHITVARAREKVDLSTIFESIKLSYPGTLHCDKLTLFESKLNPGGAQYTIIEEFALK
jgi:2'-5' RNA ligase